MVCYNAEWDKDEEDIEPAAEEKPFIRLVEGGLALCFDKGHETRGK